MLRKIVKQTAFWGCASALAVGLLACSGGGGNGGGSGGNAAGTLSFFPNPVTVNQGGVQQLQLSLNQSSGVVDQLVTLAVSDSSVATIDRSTCTLSSSAGNTECSITVTGVAADKSTLITATSNGYQSVAVPVKVNASSVVSYGSLAVATGPGAHHYVTASQVSLSYQGTSLTVYAKIANSQLLTTGTMIQFTPSSGSAAPASCSVTTTQPTCTTTITGLPTSGATAITVSGSSTQGAGYAYQAITVNAVATSTTSNGQPVLSGPVTADSSYILPQGLKGPVFVNWLNVGSKADTPTVTVSIDNWTSASPISFYQYDSTNNSTPTRYGSMTCKLDTTNLTKGCGFGIYATGTGAATISATITSSSGQAYGSMTPLTVTAIQNSIADAARVVTFTNNSSTEDLWIGITGGAASAYLSPTVAAGSTAGQRITQTSASAASYCGPTNPANACPVGSSCLQPGQGPASSKEYSCFWDQPTPVGGTSDSPYQMTQGGGTTKMYISKYSLAPASANLSPMHWSGNFYARQQCSANGSCKVGSCNFPYSGSVGGCAAGTGATPLGLVTLGEVTFQATNASTISDYYDVSIINGVNKSLQFGVNNVVSGDPYTSCGIAGSKSTQGGGYSVGTATGIGTSTWQFTPSASSYPVGVSGAPTSDFGRFFRLVDADAATATQCASAANPNLANCSGTQVCGYAANNSGTATSTVVQGGSNFTGQDLYCGNPLAWITADSIWPVNTTGSDLAPFGFNTVITNGPSVGNLQICEGGSFSAYVNSAQGATYACGGVAWDNQTAPVQGGAAMTAQNLTRVSGAVQWANPNWIAYVQPTLMWLKQACPSCYTYPFDDKSSTFQCYNANDSINYMATFGDTR